MRTFDLRLAWWQTRGQTKRAWLFVFCLAVGVAARVAVGSFMGQLDQGLSREARQILLADVEIASRQPLPEKNRSQLVQILPEGGRAQEMLNFVTMASTSTRNATEAPHAPAVSRLVELRAVEPGYPFYGTLRLSDQEPLQGTRSNLEKLFAQKPQTYVQPELLLQLGIRIGDKIRIGKTDFEIAGTILQEPGLGTRAFSLGPRVLIGLSHVQETGLVAFGSRVQYATLVALPDISLAVPFSQKLKEAWDLNQRKTAYRSRLGIESGIEVRSFREPQGEIRLAFDRLADYLRLVSLMALLVGGIGIASMVRGFVHDNLESIGILRTLGASSGRILRVYFFQCLGLGLLGSLFGIGLGSSVQNLLPVLFKDLLPVKLTFRVDFGAITWGLFLGLFTAAYFTFLPLLEVRNIKPMELFREGTSIPLKGIPTLSFLKRKRGMEYGLLIAGALLFILIAILEAHSLTLGPYFIVVLLLGGLLLYGSSHLVLPSLSRIRPWWISFGTRHGLSNLSRPGLRPYSAIAALGLTALLLGILSVYQFSLLKDLDPGQRVEALPNFFLIDIQTDQVESLEIFLKERGVRDFVLRPMVKARYRGLNGQGFGDEKSLTREDERAEWARNREQNLSYRTELSADETLLKGRWLDPNSQEIEASLEKGYAERLGADVGDVLTFDVQGVEINAKVTSIRKIQWSSFRPNFFILISPKVLEDAPQVWVGSISGMDKPLRDTVQADIVHLFPNITLFDVAQTSQQILRILDRIIWAIRFIALFSLGAGLVVLVGIALSTARQRQMDAVLLKVLGAGRRTLLASIATEFGLLGAVSSLAGLVLAVGFGWLLLAWFLEIRFAVPWPQLLAIFVGLTVICALAGILTCQRILRAKPLEVLREG